MPEHDLIIKRFSIELEVFLSRFNLFQSCVDWILNALDRCLKYWICWICWIGVELVLKMLFVQKIDSPAPAVRMKLSSQNESINQNHTVTKSIIARYYRLLTLWIRLPKLKAPIIKLHLNEHYDCMKVLAMLIDKVTVSSKRFAQHVKVLEQAIVFFMSR